MSDAYGKCCPILWQSRKLKRVVKSTLAAECLALEEVAESAFYLKTIMNEMMNIDNTEQIQIDCYTDNRSLVNAINSSKTLQDKRLILDLALLKEMYHRKEINTIEWVKTDAQLADCLTKRGATAKKLHGVLQSGMMA